MHDNFRIRKYAGFVECSKWRELHENWQIEQKVDSEFSIYT